jgi:hypothetical protein
MGRMRGRKRLKVESRRNGKIEGQLAGAAGDCKDQYFTKTNILMFIHFLSSTTGDWQTGSWQTARSSPADAR